MADSLDYRLYLLDRDGRIVRAEIIRCPGDPEAITTARERAAEGPYATEVWFRSRRVGHYPQGVLPPRGAADTQDV